MGALRPRIWVTRTAPPALQGDMGAAWRAAGFDPICAPVLEVTPQPTCPAPPPLDAILALTSGHAIAALARLTSRRHWPIYAVGQASAALARQLGFTDVIAAGGDVRSLSALMIQNLPNTLRPIVHLSGRHVAGDLVGDLGAAGLTAMRTALYGTAPVQNLDAIPFESLQGAAVYSPRGAEAFAALTPPRIWPQLQVICISRAVAERLTSLPLGGCWVANQPSQANMIETAAKHFLAPS